jgi:hypothetical protein
MSIDNTNNEFSKRNTVRKLSKVPSARRFVFSKVGDATIKLYI